MKNQQNSNKEQILQKSLVGIIPITILSDQNNLPLYHACQTMGSYLFH